MTRIDRRALFASGAAAALLAATGVSAKSAPRPGGVLRIAVPREGGLMEQTARGAVYDTLTEIAPDGLLRGELATSWEAQDGARVWTFDLREGVTFHDGSALTAADAAASLAAQPVEGAGITGAVAAGPLQLRLELSAPNPHLPYLLAASGLSITRAGQADLPLEQALGTGCYRVERAQEGRHFRAVRVAGHYKAGHAGWADAVEAVVIPDAAVRAEALRDGYVDVAALPEPAGLLQRGRFQYHPSASDMALAARADVGVPRVIGSRAALDDGRIAERWWRI
ncbi:ABC transporter substrate-binding protein [Roseobacteraceae bacterium NS-SX3]